MSRRHSRAGVATLPRRWPACAVVLFAAALLVTGVAPGAEATPTAIAPLAAQSAMSTTTAANADVSDDVVDAVTAALDGRNDARSERDRDGFMSSVADDADGEFIEREGRSFDNGVLLGVVDWTEELSTPVVDLTPPGTADRRLVLAVTRRWRVDGIDTWPRASTVILTFGPTASGWVVVADDALDGIGLGSDRELWEIDDVDIVRRDRVVVVGTAGRSRLEDVAGVTVDALARFDDLWSPEWDRQWAGSVMVVVPSGVQEVENLLRPTSDVSRFVAFTTLDVERGDDGWSVVSPRIVTQESNFSRRSRERQVEIMVHELAHVASVRASGPATPLWLHEGFAEWLTNGRAETDGDIEFPDLFLFRTGGVSEISTAYDRAEATMASLAFRLGPDAPWQMFVDTGSLRSDPGSADHLVGTVLVSLQGAAG